MVSAYEDALECECFLSGEYCLCEEGCECGCPDCMCEQGWSADDAVMGGCPCGGNCICNQEIDEEEEGGTLV